MVINLKRKIQTELLTTYLPTILLLGITYATTFFKSEYFEASVTVNLTIMLVMTTIFTSKIEELPPTSDTKMIDIWLIFCLLVPFAFTLIQTAIECYREDTSRPKRPEAWSGPVEDGSVVCTYPIPILPIKKNRSSILQDGQEGGSNQCGPKSDKEKPKSKATWQGVAGWVTKHDMAFDTLKTLQWAGWLFFSNAITTTLLWVSPSKFQQKFSSKKELEKNCHFTFPTKIVPLSLYC